MTDTSLRVVARAVARPDKIDELRSTLLALIEPTRKEPGCIRYEMLQNNSDPTDFTFVEEWESDAALNAHLETDHFKEVAAKLPDLIVGQPDIRRYSVVA